MYVNHDPLTDSQKDRLNRAASAKLLGGNILATHYQQGLVVGVMGDWGNGKSTYLNFLRSELETSNATSQIVEFNPWMFSGSNQLVELFLAELAQQLSNSPKLKAIGNAIGGLGTLVSIFDGISGASIIGKAAAKAGKLLSKDASVVQQRKKIETLLSQLDKPLVILIDDIDRLSVDEIRDIFRLVRLVANFPNVIYLLAFDRRVVTSALSDDQTTGDNYLEKIIQIPVQLPAVPQTALQRALLEDISNIPTYDAFDEVAWTDVYLEVVKPLVRNMRDVNKYLSAVHITQSSFQGSVSMVDLMALEAVRLFLPSLFETLESNMEAFADPARGVYVHNLEGNSVIHNLIDELELGEKRKIAESFIRRILPIGYSHIGRNFVHLNQLNWLRTRRVAHIAVLQYYFEREENSQLKEFDLSIKMYSCMSDEKALSKFVDTHSNDVYTILNELSRDENSFSPEQFIPTTVVLLNFLDKTVGASEFDGLFILSSTVRALANSIKNRRCFFVDVDRIFYKIQTLSSKQLFINILRRSKLIPLAVAEKYDRVWVNELLGYSEQQLLSESRFTSLLKATRSYNSTFVDKCLADDTFALAILQGAEIKVNGWGTGSSHVYTSSEHDLEYLENIYGSKQAMLNRYSSLNDERNGQYIELFLKQVDLNQRSL